MYNAQNISWIGDYTVSSGSSPLKVSLPSDDVMAAFQGAGNTNPDLYTRTLGKKKYEINDHLGNVRSVVSDIKLSSLSSTYVPQGFHPDILAASNYYAFGMELPGRTYSSNSYRYGFQGQEKDDEIKGSGNSINYKYRMHDPRLGRFFAVDPLAPDYPWNSPYAFSENRVIDGVELEGLEHAHYMNIYIDQNGGQTVIYAYSEDMVSENANTIYVTTVHNTATGQSASFRQSRKDFYNFADDVDVLSELPDRSFKQYTKDEWMGGHDYDDDVPSPEYVDMPSGQVLDPGGAIEVFKGGQAPQVSRQNPSIGDFITGKEYPPEYFQHGDTVLRDYDLSNGIAISPEKGTSVGVVDTTDSDGFKPIRNASVGDGLDYKKIAND